MTRALLVMTSHDDLGGVRDTGYFVGEAAHPWKVFRDAGWQVDLASIEGGEPPQDGRDEDDPIQTEFLAMTADELVDTPKLSDVDPADYDAVYFVGGHGAMWDFPTSPAVDDIARAVYHAGGVVAAVCHGPAALANIRLEDGTPLASGKRVAGFANDEEAAVGLTEAVPFLLADKLESIGATHVPGPNFTENVVVDGRLVTGQNPQSAAGVARETLAVVGG
ncbi:type 1 glutamine amidotransferase domain-containing protein [Aeromicrobium camelliae]|uniref:Type 1 glutamine amidotransferase domain-containing protein n=1 Tax=Aeromicrobium camelliae TaxID=1538144 RepID=A0A3N6X5H4_9ACTN|nr:type 1 glutamine amidotransferase domain-containing protein [Aeromicrobium camelliae]RQN09375.1 type 1 glutamine amidotransferase domain-containing protein [Aeromicrobium camelliae]